MVVKVIPQIISFQKQVEKYVGYTKQQTTCVKDIGNIEIHHVLDFLGAIIYKGVINSTINNAKFVRAIIIYIPNYPSINKHSLFVKYVLTGVFNSRPPNPKLSIVIYQAWILY